MSPDRTSRDHRCCPDSAQRIALERVQSLPVVSLSASLENVFEIFRTNKDQSVLPVVNDLHHPAGIIVESDFKEYNYSPFGRELLQNTSYPKTISHFLRSCPIVEFDELTELVLDNTSIDSGFEGVIITDGLRYHGFISVYGLLEISYEKQVASEKLLIEHRDLLQQRVEQATADLRNKAHQLESALAKEKELNEQQRQFVSMASHEFRTPLAIIDSSAQRLKKRVDELTTDAALKRIEKIRKAVARMTRLMDSTLTVARMEEGKIAVEIAPCEIGALVHELCARQQDITDTHTISCEACDLPDTISADASAIEQILTNLLSNAIKYAPDAPDVRVTVSRRSDDVLIEVADQGLGIDEDDLPHMFNRFFRAKTSAGIAGTGIGLNLVKMLVEMHDGSVAVKSTKGKGTTFTVSLPIAGPKQPKPASSMEAA